MKVKIRTDETKFQQVLSQLNKQGMIIEQKIKMMSTIIGRVDARNIPNIRLISGVIDIEEQKD